VKKLQRYQTLVMVHGDNRIIPTGSGMKEEGVRGKGTVDRQALLTALLYGRLDDLLLFGAEDASLAGMGVEPCHRQLGGWNTPIVLQPLSGNLDDLLDPLLRQGCGDLPEGEMCGHQGHAQPGA